MGTADYTDDTETGYPRLWLITPEWTAVKETVLPKHQS